MKYPALEGALRRAKAVSKDELLLVLRRALERSRLVRENRLLQEQLQERFRLENIVGAHGSMQDVFRLVHKVAGSHSTVLIYGESGTGKELVARALHQLSPRRERPLFAINVAALPESLLEAELFGYEKGAFTGAESRKVGLFEQASGSRVLAVRTHPDKTVYAFTISWYIYSVKKNAFPKIDRTAFVISDLRSPSDDKLFWFSKSPHERLEAIEQMRQILYGYNPSSTRLQRIFEVAQRPSG